MRTLTEWLLLPLFLLPFAVGGGLAWLAADAHRRELQPYRETGEQQARLWLRDPANAGWIRSYVDKVVDQFVETQAGWIDFSHPKGPGRVRLSPKALGPEPWILARAYPSGLRPEALADAGVRLRVETGAATAELPGADPATVAFRDLYADPDLDGLRTAPLPASTKLFLLRRWRRTEDDAALAEAERLLDVLRRATADWPPGPGAHRIDEISLLAPDGAAPVLVYPDPASLPPGQILTAGPDVNHSINLHWSFPPRPIDPERTLWSGRLEGPLAGEFRFITREGAVWWRSSRVRRWAGPVVGGLLVFLLLPTALLISLRRRRLLDETRARFINELAHDLRTPLTSLRLYTDMLAGGKAKEEDRGRYVEVIARESARLTSLLGNLLDLSRLEGRRRTFEPEDLLLDEVVELAVGDFVALYPQRADDIRITGPDDTKVRADRTALSRCLGNLLDNAGKFTEPGTTVSLGWEAEDGRVLILVSDEGPGIPEAERHRVFDRYARGKKMQRDGVPGTGLGLSLVKELCAGMGGSVRLLSGPDGAAFELDLPEVDHE